jgi:hypothetical protein
MRFFSSTCTLGASLLIASFLFLLLCFQGSLRAQTCAHSYYVLNSQSEVDAFDCTSITGVLAIQGSDITNLGGLTGLTSVSEVLIINSTGIENLNGLSGLAFARSIWIENNPALTSLTGFSSPLTVSGSIWVYSNPLLASLSGLEPVSFLGSLMVLENPNLLALADFTFTTIDTVMLHNNPLLTDINGFLSLLEVTEGLSITQCPSLTNVDAFSSLSSGDFSLYLMDNDGLTNVDGFSALTHVTGISISDNDLLTNLDGFSWITSVNYLEIKDNISLNRCCGLHPLLCQNPPACDLSGVQNNVVIENNGGAMCNSVSQVLDNGPCMIDPVTLIADYVDAGILNAGQGNSLTLKVDKCKLGPLGNQLNGFVNAGILTQAEADAILAGAISQCPAARLGHPLPEAVMLFQNYPNPAYGFTTIAFQLVEETRVSLKLYDANGIEITELAGGLMQAGKHEIQLDARDLATGIYFYRLQTGSRIEGKMMTVLN